jgi:hypothetical protein
MFKNSIVLLSLTLTIPVLDASKSGIINVFPNCSTVSGNLAQNCGFETGTFEGWDQSGDTSSTTVDMDAAHSGSFGARIGPVRDLGFLSQTLATVPGQLYTLSFWMRSAGRPNQFLLYWDGAPISTCVGFPETPSPGLSAASAASAASFDQFEFEGLVASGDRTVLTFGFFNRPDYFFLDDVVLIASPSSPESKVAPKSN